MNINNPAPSTSYPTAVKTAPKPSFPKKDQAIVMHADDSLNSDPYMEARKHIEDINGLVSNLNLIYLDLTDISIKNRITRIINKIMEKLKPDAEETENSDMTNDDDSDSSQQSQKSSY
ncbi:hypothetical protein JTB14_033782 [Gonioctena quinquepunctata]|nr:hypothetical protein JTB14_033782 [Gonioctena quinquepunctata]